MISYFGLECLFLFLNYVHSGQSQQMIFSPFFIIIYLFLFFTSVTKIFVSNQIISIKNTREPFSEKPHFDYLCGSFHSSFFCANIFLS